MILLLHEYMNFCAVLYFFWNQILVCLHLTGLCPFSDVFLLLYSIGLHRHRVMRRPGRRKRNAAGPAPRLTKRRGGRKRNWKATRRKAKRTKGNRGRITRRKKKRGNTNPHLLLPAPVNLQTVTETTEHIYYLQTLYK